MLLCSCLTIISKCWLILSANTVPVWSHCSFVHTGMTLSDTRCHYVQCFQSNVSEFIRKKNWLMATEKIPFFHCHLYKNTAFIIIKGLRSLQAGLTTLKNSSSVKWKSLSSRALVCAMKLLCNPIHHCHYNKLPPSSLASEIRGRRHSCKPCSTDINLWSRQGWLRILKWPYGCCYFKMSSYDWSVCACVCVRAHMHIMYLRRV